MAADADRFDWIRLVRPRGKAAPPSETEADLDAAEQLLGSPLPATYREFARRFGLGGWLHELPELFPLLPSAKRRGRGWANSIIDATRFWRSPEVNGLGDELPAIFLRHAIVFGCDQGELTFLFQTGEVTNPAASEYRIYQIPRHASPEPICDSFEEWLRWIHKGYNPSNWGDAGEGTTGDPNASETMPYVRSPR